MNAIRKWWRKLAATPVGGHSYSDDIEWSIAAAQSYSRTGRYGNVSLQQEGEAWRSTLCHGPDDCRN
jgi:hypothetical protein